MFRKGKRQNRYIGLICMLITLFLAMVMYVSADQVAPLDWEFSTSGDVEGWTANSSIQNLAVQNGRLSFQVIGSNPAVTSGTISVDATAYNVVDVRLVNTTSCTTAMLQWTTSADGTFDDNKSVAFAINANSADTLEYQVKMTGHDEWSGTITAIRIGFLSTSGTINIDEVRFDTSSRELVTYVGQMNPISADETTITVTGLTGTQGGTEGAQLKLYELAPYQYEQDTQTLTPVATLPAPSGGSTFSFSISRYDGQRDRVYSKFVVVEQTADTQETAYIAAPQYITDIQFEAENEYAYPTVETKKGLLVEMTDDAEELGIDHAIVNVEFSTMMYEENLDPDNTIVYTMDGTEYYFSREYFETLDRKIKPLSDNGIIVNLVLILYPNFPDNNMTEVLRHPNAVMGTGGGGVLAFNTVEEEGVQAFKAAMEFLASRYTREDQLYGRALGYIVGNEVDAQWEWQNMGYATLDQFVEQYEPALRIAYMAVRKHYEYARVYTSLTNHWTDAYDSNPLKGYAARKVIDRLNWQSKQNGDFPWHVAYHPYPEDFFNADTWNDEKATDSVDTDLVTFKNIHILHDYMESEPLKYGTEKRRIILSEQGFHTSSSTEEAQKEQAAAYAYAYYKTAFLDGIDSFCLFCHVDIPSYGLNMGLWTQDSSVSTPMVAEQKKYIYNVFKYIDTDQSLQVTDFAKDIIGVSSWSSVVPGFDSDKLSSRTVPVEYPLGVGTTIPDNSTGDSFDAGVDDWIISDNANSIQQVTDTIYSGTGALRVDFNSRAMKGRGAEKQFTTPINASNMPYLHLAYRLTGTSSDNPYCVKVKVYSGLKVAEGTVSVAPSDNWAVLCMNLSGWDGLQTIDRIKVLASSEGTEYWSGSLLLDEVKFSASGTTGNNNTKAHTLPSNEKILFNFEHSTQNWVAGENVDTVSYVQTMANAPFTPVMGNHMLEAAFPTDAADVWRTVELSPEIGLDLSNADAIAYAINSYGGSGGTGYETRIRLYSDSQTFENTSVISADSWNQIYVDLTGWSYRNNVTKIEISFRATGTSSTWYGSRFQLDMIRTVEHDNLENEVNLVELSMQPFWQGTTMYNESVLMVSHAGELPEANLLFSPTAILSVRSARLDQEYEENVDWVLENGKIKLTANSRIPYLTADELYYSDYIEGATMPKTDGGAVLYREGSYFHDRQIVITYTHAENAWEGPIPQLADETLTTTFSKLRSGEPLTMVLYGDSIADGSNSSGFVDAPPHLPNWGQLVAKELENHYGSHITFVNESVGGTTSQWGAAQAADRVAVHNPDLVIIAFGMNDGSGTGVGDGVTPSVFKNNILSIINSVRLVNSNAEFILVGTTLPNAETIFLDQQPYYYTELQSIASSTSGVATANLTAVHSELLEHKSFIDMTGNNINHPNDFLSRWYAQFVVGMLKDSAFVPTQSTNVRRLYSFEDGLQGWESGDNINAVNVVSSFANWPFGPQQGSYTLEAQFPTQAADTWRTILVEPEQSLDLSRAGDFFYYINSYGGSGGSGYETRLRLYSNSNIYEVTNSMQADTWNYISADISAWAYKHEVTKIEISFRATGSSADWYGSRFQIDNVGYEIEEITLYDFEGAMHSWEAGANVISVNSVDSFANSPTKPIHNAYALEAIFPYMAADEWRTIVVEPEQAIDLSSADFFYYYINSYGGSGGTGYETRIRLYSGTDVREQTVAMNADAWNRIEIDISAWQNRNNITRIEISFRATETSALWYSSRFQIDNVGYRTN